MDDSHVGGGVKSAIWIIGNRVLDLRMITYSSENGQPTNLFRHADSGHGSSDTMGSKSCMKLHFFEFWYFKNKVISGTIYKSFNV